MTEDKPVPIEEPWRPFGVENDDEVAQYDALHDGVPPWMAAAFWTWVRSGLTKEVYANGRYVPVYDNDRFEVMCQVLRIEHANLQSLSQQLDRAEVLVKKFGHPLRVADYMLASGSSRDPDGLAQLLERSNSAWTVGERSGRRGLVRRVPEGVQVGADHVMGGAGKAGVRLAKAWEALYGVEADASKAYGLAIKAVEDAAIPVVSPTNASATLGTVISQMRQQGDWRLPMAKEHEHTPSTEALVHMMRLLWHGQHDRHGGGEPSKPGDVSTEEATVAVSLAVTLVNLFSTGLVARPTS